MGAFCTLESAGIAASATVSIAKCGSYLNKKRKEKKKKKLEQKNKKYLPPIRHRRLKKYNSSHTLLPPVLK